MRGCGKAAEQGRTPGSVLGTVAEQPICHAGLRRKRAPAEPGEVEELPVGKLRRCDGRECAEHVFAASRMPPLPLAEHLLDRLALQGLLRSAEIARHDRKT